MTTRKQQEPTVWSRLEGGTISAQVGTTPAAPTAASPFKVPAIGHVWLWRVLNIMGLLCWTYVFLKLFVADVDRVLLTAVAPSALPLLDYRLVFYLGVTVVVFWRGWLLHAFYVIFFPFLVCFVWIPWFLVRFFVRHRSWAVFLGLLQAASALLRDLRYNFMTKSMAAIAAIVIITTGAAPLIWASATYLAALMIWSLWRRVRGIFLTPSFVSVQQKTIQRVMNSSWLQQQQVLSDEYKGEGIDKYDATQAQQVALTISYGIGINKLLYLWAYQLGRYRRRYSPSVVFNLVTFGWVFVAALTGLTLLNVALIKVSPEQYTVAGSWGPISPIVYSLSTFWLAEAGGIHPVGQMGYLLQLAGALTGGLLLFSVGLSVVLTFLRERDDAAIQRLIDELKDEARKQEERFTQEYAVTIDEAYVRLSELGANVAGVLTFLIQSIPSGFTGEDRTGSTANGSSGDGTPT